MSVVAAPLLIIGAIFSHVSGLSLVEPVVPDWTVIARCAVVAITASTAHLLIYSGTVRAGASSVAPMSYVQIVVASLLGWWWFGHVPDALTLLGVAVIIASGLVLWHRMHPRTLAKDT